MKTIHGIISKNWIFVFLPFLLGLSQGDQAPQFSAMNQNGKAIQLSDLKGKFVLLFFYPKDETSGCTREATQFRNQYDQLKRMNTEVFGVSRQDAKSHKKFIEKLHLPFDLLIDSDGSIAEKFGVGKIPIVGLHKRQSVLIDPRGQIVKFYSEVDPDTHAQQVLEDLLKANLGTKGQDEQKPGVH